MRQEDEENNEDVSCAPDYSIPCSTMPFQHPIRNSYDINFIYQAVRSDLSVHFYAVSTKYCLGTSYCMMLDGLGRRSSVFDFLEKKRLGRVTPDDVVGEFFCNEHGACDPTQHLEQLRSDCIYDEAVFLRNTESFYSKHSKDFLRLHTIMEYIHWAEQWLNEEQNAACNFLCSESLKRLMGACEKILVKQHLGILKRKFKRILRKQNKNKIGNIYNFVARCEDALDEFCDAFGKHAYKRGMATLERLSTFGDNPKVYVTTIVKVHKMFTEFIRDTFRNNFKFVAALHKACCEFINKNAFTIVSGNPAKSSELVAKYYDELLANSSQIPIEQDIDDGLIVFQYLEDKDLFGELYSLMLAKRLVSRISMNYETERYVISLLRQACGFNYTSRLQRMLQDGDLSKELTAEFQKYLSERNSALKLNFQIQVLSNGFWPFTQSPQITPPSELEHCINNFKEFYNAKHCGRKLFWQYNLCMGDILGNLYRKRYTFKASAFQIAVLLQFNSKCSYLVGDIMEATKLEMDLLIQVIQTLLNAKLLWLPNGEQQENITANTVIFLCKDYQNKKLCVNINSALNTGVNLKQDNIHQISNNQEDRKYSIQACIIRVMKIRKVYQEHELVSEVVTLLRDRFKPSVQFIQKCINTLIEKDYLRVTPGQQKMYSYVPK